MKDLFTVAPLTDVMRESLGNSFQVHHVNDMADPVAWLAENGNGIEYVLTDGHYGLAPEYLAGLPDLKLVSSNGVGYDAIDTDATTARGVPVSHTPNVLNDEVATTALMLFIATWRNLEA